MLEIRLYDEIPIQTMEEIFYRDHTRSFFDLACTPISLGIFLPEEGQLNSVLYNLN